MASVHIAERLEELDPFVGAWDALAVAQRQPLLRPEWLLAWWRARCREGLSDIGLRVVLLSDAQGLAAVAPMFIDDTTARVTHMRFLGGFGGGTPLVRSDVVDDTVGTLVAVVSTIRPRPSIVSFELIDVGPRWPDALVRAWPAPGVWLRRGWSTIAVAVQLDGTFADWVHTRGAKWRGDYRRLGRRLEERRGVVRRARTPNDVSRGLSELIRLHDGRRTHESEHLTPVLERTFREAGERLLAHDGFRLWTVEVDGQVIGATAFAAAGGTVTALLTGFDPAWGRFAPGLRSIVAGVEEGFQLGDERMDLGRGHFPYKFKLANEVGGVASYELFARDRRYPLVRAHELPRHARERGIQARVHLRARTRLTDARNRVLARTARLASR